MFRLCLLQILFLFSVGVRFSTSQIADTVEKIKTATGIQNVLVTDNETIFELSNNGESRTYFSLVVPNIGFEYVIETPFVQVPGEIIEGVLGFVTLTFDDPLLSNQTIMFFRAGNYAVIVSLWHLVKFERYMIFPRISISRGESAPIVTPFTVFPNGSALSFPLDPLSTAIHFPSLTDAPVYGTDRRIINLKLYWVDATGPMRIKFPSSVSFLSNDSSSIDTTTVSPSTTDYFEVTTTTKKGLFKEKWWLIVDINAILVMFNGVIIGILIYKLLRFCARTDSMASSATLSTATCDMATTEIPPRRS